MHNNAAILKQRERNIQSEISRELIKNGFLLLKKSCHHNKVSAMLDLKCPF